MFQRAWVRADLWLCRHPGLETCNDIRGTNWCIESFNISYNWVLMKENSAPFSLNCPSISGLLSFRHGPPNAMKTLIYQSSISRSAPQSTGRSAPPSPSSTALWPTSPSVTTSMRWSTLRRLWSSDKFLFSGCVHYSAGASLPNRWQKEARLKSYHLTPVYEPACRAVTENQCTTVLEHQCKGG